jgi:hypothetical protein
VTREELAHILRAASQIAEDNEIVVLGSQSILGSFEADDLPDEATRSIEADIAFMDDPDENKSDLVDGGIGEESSFHEMYGYYGQGLSIATALTNRLGRSRRSLPANGCRSERGCVSRPARPGHLEVGRRPREGSVVRECAAS